MWDYYIKLAAHSYVFFDDSTEHLFRKRYRWFQRIIYNCYLRPFLLFYKNIKIMTIGVSIFMLTFNNKKNCCLVEYLISFNEIKVLRAAIKENCRVSLSQNRAAFDWKRKHVMEMTSLHILKNFCIIWFLRKNE